MREVVRRLTVRTVRRVRAVGRNWFAPRPHLPHRRLVLTRYPLGETIRSVRAAYERAFGLRGPGTYREADWRRVSFALDQLQKGGALLDVGPNRGQFPNVVVESSLFDRVTAVDVRKNKHFLRLHQSLKYEKMSVAALEFADDTFDVVTCFEVLEHLEPSLMPQALRELRRVCRRQLLMSVPYAEPEPISKYHKQRFVDEDLVRLFPRASLTLLKHKQTQWMHIEEWDPEP